MLKTTKKVLCTTAITAILNLSFQPAYAVKIEELDDSANHSTFRPLMKEDLPAETLQTICPTTQSLMPELVKEVGSYSFSALKGLMQLPRLASKGITYAVKHPMEALILGLAGQVSAASVQLASLKNGNAFAVWSNFSKGENPPYDAILGRIFSSSGTALTNPFPIYETDLAYLGLINPQIACLNDGNVFVTFTYDPKYMVYNNLGRIFSPNGEAITDAFNISLNKGSMDPSPVVGLENGNAFVAGSGNSIVEGDIFNSDGTVAVKQFNIGRCSPGGVFCTSLDPSVASLPNSSTFVAWSTYSLEEKSNYIAGKIFSSNGTNITKEFVVGKSQLGDLASPDIASLKNNNLFSVWSNVVVVNQKYIQYLSGRILTSTGKPLGSIFNVSQTETNEAYPVVAGLKTGNAFVAWNNYQNYNVVGRIFYPDGTSTMNQFNIGPCHTNYCYGDTPSIAVFDNGNVFVSWGNSGRIFSENGIALSQEFQIDQVTPSPITTGASSNSGGQQKSTYSSTSQVASTKPTSSSFITSSEGIKTSASTSVSQMASTNLKPSSSVSATTNPTTENIPTSQMTSNPSPASIVVSSYPTSEAESSRTLISLTTALIPSSSPPFSPPVQHSSSENSKGMSWKTIAAISGGVGGAFVAGVVGTIAVKKCCFSQKKKSGYARLENLEENAETPTT